jgi:PilZ domain-containing protein
MERKMDTRLGERIEFNRPIRIVAARNRMQGIGRLVNLSRSGAFILGCDLNLFSLVQVDLDPHRAAKSEDTVVAAYVTRVEDDGVGIEWCEYAPSVVSALLRFATLPASSVAKFQTERGVLDWTLEGSLQYHLH